RLHLPLVNGGQPATAFFGNLRAVRRHSPGDAMAKQNLVPLLAASTMLLGSCASILNSGKQSMTLDSEPSGAMVYVNGNERGTTPFNYTYHPDDGKEVAFELRRTGYRTTSVTLRPGRSNGVLFVDAMLL